ncbi:DUF3320 domain-containing protein [Paracoccus ravus]|uniref:DUF3320 domain-containing protein n=1 Tax=Paracoccus ravus TaxID=2447760 RepID=UPI00106EF4AA|nr:DUF3320 domain-containing protein [Paracoccus ravus]
MQDDLPLPPSEENAAPATPATPGVTPQPPLALTVDLRSKINFASSQNGVSVLLRLVVANPAPTAARDVVLSLRASPPVLRERQWRIDHIAPGGEIELTDLDTPLDPAILAGLDEAEIGQLDFRLDVAGEENIRETHPIELLARDEWGGLAEMENILAAFVSPNHPQVARLLKEAARLLEAAGHSGSIDGYQSGDPQRVWMLAGAIWSAATGLGLSYAVPPASFESAGQKIRDPERIVAEGLATCLDTSLLLAAAFEAAGLHTAVLFAQGHAWPGFWLVRKDFGQLIEPDVVALRKTAVSREFMPLESTLLTRRPSVGFEEAVSAGRDRLSEAHETEFLQAIDINRARAARIRPLASHRELPAGTEPEAAAPAALPRPLDLGHLPAEEIDEAPTTALGRIERWQRKLLDLSLGNKLLNFRETRLSVPLLCPDLSALEDSLAQGKQFRLLALLDENAVSGRDLAAEELRRVENELARDALGKGQIAVPLAGKDLTVRLTELYRKAKSDVQEGGTNTLFLAIGFLRWKRNAAEQRHYRAPLLLMPVRLERRSAQSEYRLAQIEDDIRINATLLEMLKRDFELRIPELEDELPRDDSGLDLARIFGTLRQRIRDVAGFELVEECAIATFSFAKYLMWKDLVDRAEQLRESPLVRHLLDSPAECFAGALSPMPRPDQIDVTHQPCDLLTPMPADSSQLAAVVAAAEGRDFVLIGPPGTGKSQTIANIIADQIGRGRTVLFVAEKSAALDVVQRRLERQGLGAAVLELHSNKADRRVVLNQLGRSWDRATAHGDRDWVQVTDELRLTRNQLNSYVAALHQPGSQGFSVFQAIGRVASEAQAPFALAFAHKDCHDAASFTRLCQLARELGQRHDVIADLDPNGPLALIAPGEWSFGWQDGLLAATHRLRKALLEVEEARAELALGLGHAAPISEASDLARAIDALPAARLGQPAVACAALAGLKDLRAALGDLPGLLAEIGQARGQLAAQYPDDAIASMPLDPLEMQWREAQTKFWPLGALAQSRLRKLLQTYAKGGNADPATDLAALRRLRALLARLAASPLRVLAEFSAEASDPARIRMVLDAAEAFLATESALVRAGLAAATPAVMREMLAQAEGGDLAPRLQRLQAALAALGAARLDFADAGGCDLPGSGNLLGRLRALDDLRPRFPDWMKWLASREKAMAAGLAPLVEMLEKGEGDIDAGAAFERAYMAWWLRLAMDASPDLRGFAHWEHDALIRRFRELDQAMTALAPAEVMRRLGNDLPARDAVPRNSELGVLRYQLGLQRPSVTIRNLIGQMKSSFPQLAPCVLMSPLSVAQYLPPGQGQFDLVIFDEASQISTWDAIGAIARGRQAIIVGDPKQLPPTNFFGRSEDDEADAELPVFEKDMPSILDEVCAAGIPTHRLNWHYRSRDEALIAFSNHNYYGGGLVTFPTPDATTQALSLHRVAGVYGRGQGRTNPEEARAVVRMIRARLGEWINLPEADRPTLGVITFNSQQQSLILDLLDAERKQAPELEWFFSDDREEPLIVKNLENIQGDERDVMLFSVTFGPDPAGKLSMSFGALNNDGGEKRLNVAVTRARAELHVFASITADRIDLSRTRARGVRDLRAFLDYAERGAIALSAQDSGSLGGVDSPFEAAVRDALERRGWEIHSQIGVSGFRIDLGVRHPDLPGVWLAGVECDGATYHRAATARDRDRVRQAVLEHLGWRILRIWSTDWFRNSPEVIGRIDAELREALEADRKRRLERDEALRLAAEAAEEALETSDQAEAEPTPEDAAADAPRTDFDPEKFFSAAYRPELAARVLAIVAESGPVTEAALARMVAQQHGWQRTGTRIQARVAEFHPMFDIADEAGTAFLWPKDAMQARWPFRGLAGRPLREISRAEIAWLEDQHEARIASAPDPVLELSRLMGVVRLSQDGRAYLEACRSWRLDVPLAAE